MSDAVVCPFCERAPLGDALLGQTKRTGVLLLLAISLIVFFVGPMIFYLD